MPTHYEVLGVPEGASEQEVRQAYRRLVKAAHPDHAGEPAQFQLIMQAYEVLSDPPRRTAYDRSLRPESAAAPAPRPPRFGRYVVLLVATMLVGSVVLLVVATMRQSVGDDCLTGMWRGGEFEVPFRANIDGRDIAATLRGGAGVMLRVAGDGRVRADYSTAAPLIGADGAYRLEGVYAGETIERWQAADGRVRTRTDASGVTFSAVVNGRMPDAPLGVTVLDGEYPYTCTPTTLEVGPYRYTRITTER